jgi:hypothetical protein
MGNTTPCVAVKPLQAAAQEALALTPEKRARTLVRLDAGGGTVDQINACLSAGYPFHGKDFCTRRARHLAASVKLWYDAPAHAGRKVGLVTQPADEYVRPVRRMALRWCDKQGQEHHCVLISSLDAETILDLEGAANAPRDLATVLVCYAHFYDARGGGIECAFKQDQQGLGRRNKKGFAAQAMLLWLECLAHNVLIWAREWLVPAVPMLAGYGLLRLVRDVFCLPGRLRMDGQGGITLLLLKHTHPMASKLAQALQKLLASQQTMVCLGEI